MLNDVPQPIRDEAQALHNRLWDVAVHTSLEHGGMINEHHGVGLKLSRFMKAQYGDAWPLLESIKRAIDPNGIMNPGKVGFEPVTDAVTSDEHACRRELERSPPITTEQDCRFCWMCRHVCPVGHVTKRETLTPHAWALLIDVGASAGR